MPLSVSDESAVIKANSHRTKSYFTKKFHIKRPISGMDVFMDYDK